MKKQDLNAFQEQKQTAVVVKRGKGFNQGVCKSKYIMFNYV